MTKNVSIKMKDKKIGGYRPENVKWCVVQLVSGIGSGNKFQDFLLFVKGIPVLPLRQV